MRCSADGGRAWGALAVTLFVGALLAFAAPAGGLEWQAPLLRRDPWRALSAAFVHYSALHLGVNLAGTLLVGALGVLARVPWSVAAAWCLAWPLTQLGLLFRPDLLRYGGLSGVLHAGVACLAWHLIAHGRGGRRVIGALLATGLALKVLGEAPWGPALRHPPGWDIATAPFAHASGLVAGVLAAAVVEVAVGIVRAARAEAAARRTTP